MLAPTVNNSVQRVCVTPTRNEAWIIDRFLAAAKCWASQVVVIDQQSSDGTLERLRSTEGVEVLVNNSPVYDEAYRQRALISQARKIAGKRVLIALDADEALSANCIDSAEWTKISQAKPGTVLRFRWVNILPGFKEAWIPPNRIACGFIDDGSEHQGNSIHSRRLPWPEDAPVIDLEEIVVLHFQYVAWDRVISKHRWYQAWEHLREPQKSALQIFRQYNHMNGSWEKGEVQSIKPEWLEGYDKLNLDFKTLVGEPITWWDRELLNMLINKGPEYFRRIAVWDKDWNAFARSLREDGIKLADPRSLVEKCAHRFLRATQQHRTNWVVRAFERLLRHSGW